jgi:HEAT repeat protein
MKVDWEVLARELGTLNEFGGEMGGSHLGTLAIEHILGAEFFEQAVEYYISSKPGFELARSVLLRIKPWSGMKHCYEIFKCSKSLDARRSAVELLRVVGDRKVLEWIPEFLSDPDKNIQSWGIGVIDQLLFWELVFDEDVKSILESALNHDNSYIREQAKILLTPRGE